MAVNGWLILDKPLGLSSTQLGHKIKKIYGTKKIGHIGTLDPLASGVLVLALGEATKLIPYLDSNQKVYVFDVTFGSQTSTDDAEGQVIQTSLNRPTKQQIEHIFQKFIGKIKQIPPSFSAIKIDGKRAYAMARAGQDIQMPERMVDIHNLDLVAYDGQVATIKVECGSGTYVRALARDMALSLGTVGYVSALRRMKDGKFMINDAISVEIFQEIEHKSKLNSLIKPISFVLDDIPAITVSEKVHSDLCHGQAIEYDSLYDGPVSLWFDGTLFGMGIANEGLLKPKRLLISNE